MSEAEFNQRPKPARKPAPNKLLRGFTYGTIFTLLLTGFGWLLGKDHTKTVAAPASVVCPEPKEKIVYKCDNQDAVQIKDHAIAQMSTLISTRENMIKELKTQLTNKDAEIAKLKEEAWNKEMEVFEK